MQKINKTILFLLLVSFGAVSGNARPVSSEGIALMAEDAAIGMSVGNLNSNFTLPGEAAEDSNTTTLDDNFTLVDKPNNKIPNPKDPNTMALITEWVRIAEPPINATDGTHTKYEPWGRAVGSTKTATLQATGKPDDVGGRTSSEYLWSMRDKLDSVDHCTLGEYVTARLDNKSIAHCKGRYKAIDSKVLDKIKKEIHAIKKFSEPNINNCLKQKRIFDTLQKEILLQKNSFSGANQQIDDFIMIVDNRENIKSQFNKLNQNIEKSAFEMKNVLDKMGDLSPKICKKTKKLNDYHIADKSHKVAFDWIQRNKNELSISLNTIQEHYKNITINKKEIGDLNLKGKTIDIDKIDNNIHNTNILLKKIDTVITNLDIFMIDNLKTISTINTRKQAVDKSLENLSKQFGTTIKNEVDKLYKQLKAINLTKCSKKTEAQIQSLRASFKIIEEKIKVSSNKISHSKKQYSDINQQIKHLDQNYKIVIKLSETYRLKAKEFNTDGALCVLLSEQIMKKVFIPIVTGMKKEDALHTLQQKGFYNISSNTIGEGPSKNLENKVNTQKPKTKSRVKKETQIILTHYGHYISEAQKHEALKNELMSKKTCVKNTFKRWNEAEKKVDCICQGPNYAWDTWHSKCLTKKEAEIDHKNFQMDSSVCFMEYPGSVSKWNEAAKRVDCICEGPTMVWNKSRNACITQKELALQNAVCNYPNSTPVWDESVQDARCTCLPGNVWNKSRTACINQKQAALENANCRNGQVAVLDYNGRVKCQCPQNKFWSNNLNKCASNYELAQDCKYRFPGSFPSNHSSGCTCPNGTTWMDGMNRCSNLNSIAQYCNQQFPGSIPQWNHQNNKQGCGCPQGSKAQNNRCVKIQSSYNSPIKVKQGHCNNANKAGGDKAEQYIFNLGWINNFKLKYNTKRKKDRIIVTQGNIRLFDSRCVGERKTVQIRKNPSNSQVTVTIQPNCAKPNQKGTEWNFTIICPK